MSPSAFRIIITVGWLLFGGLTVFFWPQLLRAGFAVEPMEPVDAAILMVLMVALLGVVTQAVVGDKFVERAKFPVRRAPAQPRKDDSSAVRKAARPGDTSRSSQRLAAVQARFEAQATDAEKEDSGVLDDSLTTVRELEKQGKFQQALALANRKGDKSAAARLHMKLGQYLHALDAYVELEDFEGAAMAATLKGDPGMARAFWRQAALNLQNAGAANPNMLGGLWDRAGNPAAAAASYEAGGMLHKATECFEVAGDLKSAERCRQRRALESAFEAPETPNADEAREGARYLAEKGDLFGAGEALVEAKIFNEAAAFFEKYGDLPRAARYYDLAGDRELANALREKIARIQGAPPQTAPATNESNQPTGASPRPASESINPQQELAKETPSKGDLKNMVDSTRQRTRPGVVAMQAAGMEVPQEAGEPPTPQPQDPPAQPEEDTASRLDIKHRPPTAEDLAATTVRNRPRPAGAVAPVKIASIDLNSAATISESAGVMTTRDDRSTPTHPPRAPFVPFPGELPTPSDLFSSPPPLPWKAGWPLQAPEPRSIGTPLFAALVPGESVLVHPPSFALSATSISELGDGVETYRPGMENSDTTAALMKVQSLAGEGRYREAAEVAAGIEAWSAAATLLENGQFLAEAADLWRRLGQWSDSVACLVKLERFEDAALLLLAAGRVARSVALLRRTIRRKPELAASLSPLLGRILVMAGRVDLATRCLRSVIAPSGPGADTAVAIYRFGRILEEHDALAEAHAVYAALLEAGARNEDLRDREQTLARELGKTRFLPADSARIVGEVNMTAFDAMVTRVDSPTDFPTVIDGRPATFLDLNADQAMEWVLRAQPDVRQRGIVRPRILAEPFPFTLPEDLTGRNANPKDATAARVVSSPLSLSLFGAPLAPPEPWVQQWRFTIREPRATLGRESLFLAEDAVFKETVMLRVFSRGSCNARGVAHVADRIRSLAAIAHPNIVPVLDMGVADLRPYIIERYYPQGSLADRIRIGGALPFAATLRVFVQIARGLEAAGRIGLVHGHIHPGQVLFGVGGEALLGSWGIEIIRRGPEIVESFPKGPSAARPDIRALGLLAYVSLAGHPPAERNALPLHGVRPDIPEAFGQIVEWCVGADPRRRYHSVGEFLPAVEQLLTAM